MRYTVLIRSVLSYASETWPLSRSDERLLSIFDRRILRYVFGPEEENGIWRKRYNHELYKLFNEPDIIGFIKVSIVRGGGGDSSQMLKHTGVQAICFPCFQRSLNGRNPKRLFLKAQIYKWLHTYTTYYILWIQSYSEMTIGCGVSHKHTKHKCTVQLKYSYKK
jgi:hypothetical protein